MAEKPKLVVVPLRAWLEQHELRLASEPEYAAEWEARERSAAAEKQRRRQVEQEARERRVRDQLVEAGVPEKDLDAILADRLAVTTALKTARDWLATEHQTILVLAGGLGTGKTTAAAWLACQVAGARVIDGVRLMRVNRYSDEAMQPLERCPLLVLDDLGVEYADQKGALASLVDGLVNTRYAARRRTVVTTNLTGADFKARYGERVADRIREAGRFVEIAEPSMRRRA